MNRFQKALLCSSALLVVCGARQASASIITEWTFENQPISGAPPYNNSPTPSTGSGTAIVLGMTNSYPTPDPSVAAADILSDPGSSDPASLQAWRIRGQGAGTNVANGWSTLAPEYTQGAEFGVSSAGFNGIQISFDWQPTNRGVEDIELQYNPNITNASGWVNAGLFSNTAAGGVWNNGNSVDLSAVGSTVNDPNFGIRIVSAYHPGTTTYLDTTGAVLNDSSGNIRLDNVSINGTSSASVPESVTFVLMSGALMVLGARYGAGVRRDGATTRSLYRSAVRRIICTL
jgi:hypothetical protein